MHDLAYYNGKFMPIDKVRISPLDRGFLFADGVYEVVPVYNKSPFFFDEHLDRLYRSLNFYIVGLDVHQKKRDSCYKLAQLRIHHQQKEIPYPEGKF